ncbi:TIGR03086 family metal-binding protein [Nocardia bovistercoris]|uniref:TIGR03086 family protein n=1 Tax=Nocardia bovistercoris TaxID=2785916 RepID=A0A931I6Z1_9NOCA|nr:TIGR03086 family metal-binding protein [Nocardia bovistercoris]MBH0776024.1 TIGR03086 family protein [Nocardia bovistercoris]
MQTVIGRIDRALDMTGKIVDAVETERLSAATPCAEWDVRTVLNHMVGGMRLYAAELAGTEPVGAHDADWLGSDPQAAYAAAAEIDRAAWHRLDVPDATVRLRFGAVAAPEAAKVHLTEVVVHGIDIALALGRPDLADDELSAELLEDMLETRGVEPFRRPGLFEPELPIAADEPAHRRLLAYLGRTWH